MYASFSRMIGIISVKEVRGHIIIAGIPGFRFAKDVHNHWKTNRINNNMFSSMGRSNVKFSSFFAIEVLYMLDELIAARRTLTGRRTLERMRTLLINQTWLRDIDNEPTTQRVDFKRLKDLTMTPFSYQMEFLENYDRVTQQYNLTGMLQDAARGSGKTFTGYALGHCLGSDTKIIVMPKNALLDVWVKTIETAFKKVPDYWHSLQGTEPVTGKEYYLVHYDYLEKFLAFVKANRNAFGRVFVDIDESHHFNEQSGRTLHLIELCEVLQARDVIHSSGTPFKALGTEATTLLMTICRDFTPEAQQAFRKIFGKEAKRAIEILANRIGIVSFKVTTDQIESPGYTPHEVKVSVKNGQDYTLNTVSNKMTAFIDERRAYYQDHMPEYTELYQECMEIHEGRISGARAIEEFDRYRDYVKTIQQGYDPVSMKDIVMYCNRYELKTIIPTLPQSLRKPFLNVRAIIKYVDLKVMGEALSQVLGRIRIQCHLDMVNVAPIDTIIDNAESKTVIFTSYVEVVKELDVLLTKAGYKPALVYGETNKDLSSIVKRFEQDEDCNPLVATFKSLSTAVPLVMANTEIFVNSPWRDYERTQAIGRVDRVGQKFHSHIHELFLDTGQEPNVSTRSKDIMAWSKAQVEQILGVRTPDDLEASLESLVDLAEMSLEDAALYMDKLKEMLPIDAAEEVTPAPGSDMFQTVTDMLDSAADSMEGLFSRKSDKPRLDVTDHEALENVLKSTYLNDAWLSKQQFHQGEYRGPGAALLGNHAGKRVSSALFAQNYSVLITTRGFNKHFKAFMNTGWKTPVGTEAFMSQVVDTEVVTQSGRVTKPMLPIDLPFPEVKPLDESTPRHHPRLASDKEAVKRLASSTLDLITGRLGSGQHATLDQLERSIYVYLPVDTSDDKALERFVGKVKKAGLAHEEEVLKALRLIQSIQSTYVNMVRAAPQRKEVEQMRQRVLRAHLSLLEASIK